MGWQKKLLIIANSTIRGSENQPIQNDPTFSLHCFICLIRHFSFCQELFALLSPIRAPPPLFSLYQWPLLQSDTTFNSLLGPEHDRNSRWSQLHFSRSTLRIHFNFSFLSWDSPVMHLRFTDRNYVLALKHENERKKLSHSQHETKRKKFSFLHRCMRLKW